MKLIDRVRPIAASLEHAEYRELIGASDAGLSPEQVERLRFLVQHLHRSVLVVATEHAKEQVRGRALTQTQADQLIAEAAHGARRCIQKLMPELALFLERVEQLRRTEQHESPEPMKA